eukprot:gene12721-2328_t
MARQIHEVCFVRCVTHFHDEDHIQPGEQTCFDRCINKFVQLGDSSPARPCSSALNSASPSATFEQVTKFHGEAAKLSVSALPAVFLMSCGNVPRPEFAELVQLHQSR